MIFEQSELKKLWRPSENSQGEDNGQITIIGGSELFTGAPLMALEAATRLVDMVFLATPEEDKDVVLKTELFGKIRSLIWVPRDDLDAYIEKSDAVLIGPGMMRYHRENDQIPSSNDQLDQSGEYTRELTEKVLKKFPNKKWVIDGGSLQTMDAAWIPKGAIITPNLHEFEILFGVTMTPGTVKAMAKRYKCVIVGKGPVGHVTDGEIEYEIEGGNAGLTKGGTGDVLAGVTVGLLAKNSSLLAAASASYLVKKTAERLFETVGYEFNSDDLGQKVFEVKKELVGF